MLRLVREMNDRGVSVDFIKENMSFTGGSQDPRSIPMFTMLGAFAQLERLLIKENNGKGSRWQRPRVWSIKVGSRRLMQRGFVQLREQAATGTNRSKLAKEFGISRETLYQYIR